MDDMYLFFTNGKFLEWQNDMYQHNYSRSPTLEEAEWGDGAKKENIHKNVTLISNDVYHTGDNSF